MKLFLFIFISASSNLFAQVPPSVLKLEKDGVVSYIVPSQFMAIDKMGLAPEILKAIQSKPNYLSDTSLLKTPSRRELLPQLHQLAFSLPRKGLEKNVDIKKYLGAQSAEWKLYLKLINKFYLGFFNSNNLVFLNGIGFVQMKLLLRARYLSPALSFDAIVTTLLANNRNLQHYILPLQLDQLAGEISGTMAIETKVELNEVVVEDGVDMANAFNLLITPESLKSFLTYLVRHQGEELNLTEAITALLKAAPREAYIRYASAQRAWMLRLANLINAKHLGGGVTALITVTTLLHPNKVLATRLGQLGFTITDMTIDHQQPSSEGCSALEIHSK